MRLARAAAVVVGFWLGAAVPSSTYAENRPAPAAERPRVAQPSPPLTPPRQCICTMEYDPVCGRPPGGAEITFSNPCRARCVGATVIRRGLC